MAIVFLSAMLQPLTGGVSGACGGEDDTHHHQ